MCTYSKLYNIYCNAVMIYFLTLNVTQSLRYVDTCCRVFMIATDTLPYYNNYCSTVQVMLLLLLWY